MTATRRCSRGVHLCRKACKTTSHSPGSWLCAGSSKSSKGELSEGASDPTRRAISKAKLAELAQRIASAVLVDPSQQDHAVVRFGATVELLDASGKSRRYAIVGVDEARVSSGKVAFVTPLARALLGKRVGDVVLVRAPHGDDELEIVRIEYASTHA